MYCNGAYALTRPMQHRRPAPPARATGTIRRNAPRRCAYRPRSSGRANRSALATAALIATRALAAWPEPIGLSPSCPRRTTRKRTAGSP
jgi:hypothetical protein